MSPAAICFIPGLRIRRMMQSQLGLGQTSVFVDLLYVCKLFLSSCRLFKAICFGRYHIWMASMAEL